MVRSILIALLLPIVAAGQDFQYKRVIRVDKGADNFAFDGVSSDSNRRGCITVTDNTLVIDGVSRVVKRKQDYMRGRGFTARIYPTYIVVYQANAVRYYWLANKIPKENG